MQDGMPSGATLEFKGATKAKVAKRSNKEAEAAKGSNKANDAKADDAKGSNKGANKGATKGATKGVKTRAKAPEVVVVHNEVVGDNEEVGDHEVVVDNEPEDELALGLASSAVAVSNLTVAVAGGREATHDTSPTRRQVLLIDESGSRSGSEPVSNSGLKRTVAGGREATHDTSPIRRQVLLSIERGSRSSSELAHDASLERRSTRPVREGGQSFSSRSSSSSSVEPNQRFQSSSSSSSGLNRLALNHGDSDVNTMQAEVTKNLMALMVKSARLGKLIASDDVGEEELEVTQVEIALTNSKIIQMKQVKEQLKALNDCIEDLKSEIASAEKSSTKSNKRQGVRESNRGATKYDESDDDNSDMETVGNGHKLVHSKHGSAPVQPLPSSTVIKYPASSLFPAYKPQENFNLRDHMRGWESVMRLTSLAPEYWVHCATLQMPALSAERKFWEKRCHKSWDTVLDEFLQRFSTSADYQLAAKLAFHSLKQESGQRCAEYYTLFEGKAEEAGINAESLESAKQFQYGLCHDLQTALAISQTVGRSYTTAEVFRQANRIEMMQSKYQANKESRGSGDRRSPSNYVREAQVPRTDGLTSSWSRQP